MRFGFFTIIFLLGAGLAQAENDKMSPRLTQVLWSLETQAAGQPLHLPQTARAAVQGLTPAGALAAGVAEPVITVIAVHENGESALRERGFELGTVTRRTAVVKVPLSRVPELVNMPEVRFADAPEATFRLHLDESLAETGGVDAHGSAAPPYSGLTGDGVVVGIIDSGIDCTHEDFKDGSGNTRLLSIWDQSYGGLGEGPPGFPYGRECTAAEIDAATCTQTDPVGHGTHVAGIAAGDGSEGGTGTPYTYVGVAPEADIVAVKFTTSKGDDAILDATQYIFNKAGSKPAVVNISLGTGLGPHDGQTALEIGLSDMTGPGRCIVAAAGNDGDVDCHAEVSIPKNDKRVVEFTMGTYQAWGGAANDVIRVNAWYEGNTAIDFTFTAPNGSDKIGPASPGTNALGSATGSGYLYMQNTGNQLNGDRQCVIQAYDSNQNTTPPSGTWSVTITNNSSSRQTVHLWVYSDMIQADGFDAEINWDSSVADPAMTLNSPSTGDDIIAVGAYVTKALWQSISGTFQYPGEAVNAAASFTSSGPRRDGVPKPEISAPGMGIMSARSVDASYGSAFIATDNQHVISQGTSQASPHVAGTVALLFEKQSDLTVSQVVDALQNSAHEDTHTFLYPDIFGAGKLRIDAAADEVTPVRLLSFTAQRQEGALVLRWETAEADLLFYRLERATAAAGPYDLLAEPEHTGRFMTWTDPAPPAGATWYRLWAVNRDGSQELLATAFVEPAAPRITLSQSAPNPAVEGTRIAFSLDAASRISLDLVDLQGRRVAVLGEGLYPAGDNVIDWDGRLADGTRAAAGVYFYRLTTDQTALTKRLVVAP